MLRAKRHRQSAHQAFSSASGSGFVAGHQVTLLENGEAYFTAIEAACDRAQHEIYLETYIYQDDATGQRVAAALKRAVQRGVRVFVLIDGYGSKDLPRSVLEKMRAYGVKMLIYRPKISPWTFRRMRLRRLHRKIVVVDHEVAFVGGLNVIDDTNTLGDVFPRYDYAVAVSGPLVAVIHLSARRLWSMVAWSAFRKGSVNRTTLPAANICGGTMSAAFVVRDNFRHRRDIEAAYMRAIAQARSEIILANAYFLPGLHFRRALVQAARRGVRVVLLLQGKSDHRIQHFATQALYGNLLAANIEIYEFHRCFLHAKVAVIDGHWSTVGSSNIDPFSLLLSREANVLVDDTSFAATLAHSLKKTLHSEGRRILSANWNQQPIGLRFICWLSYTVLRLMMGISGYARSNDPTEKK